jgi:hypothetical protein
MLLASLLYGTAHADGWGTQTTIESFYVWSAGDAHIKLTHIDNPDKCQTPQYATLNHKSPHFKEHYATVMMAYASKQKVQLFYSGCTAGGYPIVAAIAVPTAW